MQKPRFPLLWRVAGENGYGIGNGFRGRHFGSARDRNYSCVRSKPATAFQADLCFGAAAMRRLISTITRRIFPPTEALEGYDEPDLVDVIFHKTRAYDPHDDWPEMEGVSSVLDFGGGCGLHYKLARRQSPDIRWAVVETAAMLERASELATDELQFFTEIADEQRWLGTIDVMYSNSVLQYTPDPEDTLKRLCGLRANRMIWERLALSKAHTEREVQSSMLGDNGPGSLPGLKEKIVKYTRTKIPEQTFLRAHENYLLTKRGIDWFRFSLR